MLITTVARKPLSEATVADNVLVHGTGAIHIDASRLSTGDNLNGGAYSQGASARHDGTENWRYKRGEAGPYQKPTGRWPANTILQHLPGCQCLGVKAIKGVGPGSGGGFKTGKFSGQNGLGAYSTTTFKGFADEHGTETIPDWSCVKDCPVDQQEQYSRYFKQIQAGDMSGISQDLLDYLEQLITPFQIDGSTLIALDLDAVDWSTIEDNQYHGLIGRGTPSEAITKEIWRVVKPGAHVLMIAPDSSPLGYEGACVLEDQGFEIRDAILLVRESGKSHYVAKAASKERNQGCETLALARNEARYALQTSALEDEEISTVLIDAGLSAVSVDVLLDGGDISKTEVPDGVSKYFKKLPSGSKYGNNHPCLHPDSEVLTPHGYQSISTMQIGDLVYSEDGTFHTVSDVSHHDYTHPHLYEIKVIGTNITTLASNNHPFLVWSPKRNSKGNVLGGEVGWVEAQNLKKGQYTLTPVLSLDRKMHLLPEIEEFRDNLDFWFLFGLYVAEGVSQTSSHSSNVYPSYSLHRNETDLVSRIRDFFEPAVKVSVYPKGPNGIQVMAFNPKIGHLYRLLCGSLSTKKKLHPVIWNLPFASLNAILEGHIAGDGGVVRNYYQSKTSSRNLSGQLKLLGEAVGYRVNHFRFAAKPGQIQGRVFKTTSDENHLHFYSANLKRKKATRPTYIEYEGRKFILNYIKSVTEITYTGKVWNLSVDTSPTFQTAVGMSHNTCKPIAIMTKLLGDIPQDALVMDPFLGSGTTGVACVQTGHSFIGMELSPDYIQIADARVRHQDRANAAWVEGVEIVSEAKAIGAVTPMEEGVFDLFG